MNHRRNRIACAGAMLFALAVVGQLTASSFFGVDAETREQQARPENGLVVHEWGTFTALARDDGRLLMWQPLKGSSDLPRFVHRRDFRGKDIAGTIRLETPVVYFYVDRPLTASLEVGFPRGLITEWYPRAIATQTGFAWPRIEIVPGATERFPLEPDESRYYPARATDAVPLRVKTEAGDEHEKFLFYRGVGTFDLPISVRIDDATVVIVGAEREPIGKVLLFENRDGKHGFRIGELSEGRCVLERPALADPSADAFSRELASLLTSSGLFAREADAMLATWDSSWAEEGLRVFFIVPRRMTDTLLPLRISPVPSALERVLVGRVEIMTAETRQAIEASASLLASPERSVREEARDALIRHGRFARPFLEEVLENTRDPRVADAVTKFLAPPPGGS
jgi:hypothetical protein